MNVTSISLISMPDDYTIRVTARFVGATESFYRDFRVGSLNFPAYIGFPQNETTIYRHYAYSSSSQREVVVMAAISNAYIVAGYTYFVQSNTYILPIMLTSNVYYLYTFSSDGDKILLGVIDGSGASAINVDLLIWSTEKKNISTNNEDISISRITNTSFLVYYHNVQENNKVATITISDNNGTLFTYTETSHPDNITVVFDHSLINLNGDRLTVKVTRENNLGETKTIQRYIYLLGDEKSSNLIDPKIAVIISMMFAIFSITIASSKMTFGFLGIFGMAIAIVITTFAESAWYLTLTQVMLIIGIIYIFIVYRYEYAEKP